VIERQASIRTRLCRLESDASTSFICGHAAYDWRTRRFAVEATVSDLGAARSAAAVSRPGSRSKLLWAGGTVFDLVLDGSQTGGSVALLDQRGREGDTTPLHIHHHDAEIFYVLEGGVTAWANDEVHTLDEGSAIYLPAGQAHAFGIHTAHARIITVTAPAGFADFVRAAGTPVEDGTVPATWDFDLGALMAAAPQHGIEIVGPPPPLPAR
jgi:quercetin dioxygenase-like cupin family protein